MARKERLKDWCKSGSAERSSSQRRNFSLPRVVWVSRSPRSSFEPTFWNADGWQIQGKAKVIGKAVKTLPQHDTELTTNNSSQRRPTAATRAMKTQRQKFWFRSGNPAEQLAGFQHLGCETAADGKPESELKVKPEEGCIFEKGSYNCIIQGENIIMPQRWEVLFELKEHRELKMCLVACISTTTLNQSLDL